jgi:CRISPR system Cascade subunit CasA
MTVSFNLIDEPFLPVVWRDGRTEELGLRVALGNAHELRELRDDSPLVTAALHRLLLAVLHRVFGPEDEDAWTRLRDRGRWDPKALDTYLDSDCCRDRFDLFDARRPFYQVAGSPKKPGSVGRLAHELAGGNNATLFDHNRDDPPAVLSPSEAARLLIAQQAYAVGGGKSATGYTSHAPLLQGVIILPQGGTLFETLLLNLVAYNREAPIPARDDAPIWERDDPTALTSPQPRGYLDYLTWQSRTIALHPETEGRTVIRQASYAQGRKLDAPGLFDPQMAYRKSKDQGWRALRLDEDKALWRDSTALFRAASDDDRRPGCLEWLYQLEHHGVPLRQCYDLAAIGLCTNKAKVHFWRHERMPLPISYLDDIDLLTSLEKALDEAQKVGNVLHEGVRRLAAEAIAPTLGNPDRDRVRHFIDSLAPERLYWSRLEVSFRMFFRSLADHAGDPERQWAEVCRWVREDLRTQATHAFEQTAGRLDQSPRLLRAVSLARREFHRRLAAQTSPYQEEAHEQTA